MGKVPEVPKEKCKDRFLVQSAPYDGQMPNDKFEWKAHFTDPNYKPDEVKLKCSYITQADGDAADNASAPATQGKPATDATGIRQRPKPSDTTAGKTTSTTSPVTAASKEPKTSTTASTANTSNPIKAVSPTVQTKPNYTVWLFIAVVFFLIGRYTTHVTIPGL